MYVCIYIYMYMYVCIYIFACVCIYIYIYICMCICIYIYICMCICIYIYICICISICICLCIYIYVCVYTSIWKWYSSTKKHAHIPYPYINWTISRCTFCLGINSPCHSAGALRNAASGAFSLSHPGDRVNGTQFLDRHLQVVFSDVKLG